MTLEEAGSAVQATVESAGLQLLNVEGVLEPQQSAGRVVLRIEESCVATFAALVAATAPVAVLRTPADEDGFDVHLLGPTWVGVSFLTDAGLTNSEEHEEEAVAVDAAALAQTLQEAVVHVVDHTPLGEHGGARWARDALYEHLTGTPAADVLSHPGVHMLIWDHASALARAVKDEHSATMLRDAPVWAARVVAEVPLPAGASKAVCRDATYRFMRTVDGQCATRASTEAIAMQVAASMARTS